MIISDYENTPNGMKERFHKEGNKLIVETKQDLNPFFSAMQKLRSVTDGYYTKERNMKHVASIPPIVYHMWTREAQKANIKPNSREFVNFIARKLNDPDNSYFRVGQGTIGTQ